MPESTIADGLQRIINAKTDIDGAIEAKGGTVTKGLENSDEDIMTITNQYTQADEGKVVSEGTLIAQTAMPDEITENSTIDTTFYNSVTVNVPSGGGGSSSNDVNFYDYDGTIVQSYSADEFANLSELPANPTHEGLTAQGWNWSLADAKTYVTSYGKLNIGQMYASNTPNGVTLLHIKLGEGRLKPYLGLTGNSSGTAIGIDWGDGSTIENVTLDTSTIYTPHEYSSDGEYTISITVTSGTISLNHTSNSANLFRKSSNEDILYDRVYANILTKAELGTGVTSIGDYAFTGCNSLTSITIPSSLTSIGNFAFSNCTSLTSVTIPSTVTSIGASVFYQCYSLISISLSSLLTSIGNFAFSNCSSLTSVTIPPSVTSIGANVFYNCYSLTSITLPSTITLTGNYAFSNCYSLTSITIPVTSIGTYAFQNCFSLTSVIIPSTVTSIGSYAFSECYSLTSVTIPSTVTSIGLCIFQSCNSLTSITIPPSVTSIGIGAFQSCSSLTSITIPPSVTSIGGNAFNSARGLGFIKFERTTPPTVTSSNTWASVPTDCIIYVPTGTLSAYKSATNYPNPSTYTYEEY